MSIHMSKSLVCRGFAGPSLRALASACETTCRIRYLRFHQLCPNVQSLCRHFRGAEMRSSRIRVPMLDAAVLKSATFIEDEGCD